jgi:hypothetical protein
MMNRIQRRAQERAERRGHKLNRSRAIYTGHFQLEFETFDTIERLFEKIRNGALEYIGPHPVVMGLHGEHYHVLPALDGWIKYWRVLTEEQDIAYDDNALEFAMPLTDKQAADAYGVVILQRALYRALPKAVTTKVAHEVQRDIQLTDEITLAMQAASPVSHHP